MRREATSIVSTVNVCITDPQSDMLFKKIFANMSGLNVNDNPEWMQPKIGDRVKIISFDTQVNVQECVRVSKLNTVTVKEVIPEIVGIGRNRYCWAYVIRVEETHLEFMQWHYQLICVPN